MIVSILCFSVVLSVSPVVISVVSVFMLQHVVKTAESLIIDTELSFTVAVEIMLNHWMTERLQEEENKFHSVCSTAFL